MSKNKFVTVAGIQSAVSPDLKENLINTVKMVEHAIQGGGRKLFVYRSCIKHHIFHNTKKPKKIIILKRFLESLLIFFQL